MRRKSQDSKDENSAKKEWKVDTVGVLVGAFVGLFLFTLIYEIARFYQSRFVNYSQVTGLTISSHQIRNQEEGTYRYGTFGSGAATSVSSNQNREHAIPLHVRVRIAWNARYILRSLSFPLLVAANYFIMLAVMTYNAWLLIAVCLASGLAYFLLQCDHDIPAVKHDVVPIGIAWHILLCLIEKSNLWNAVLIEIESVQHSRSRRSFIDFAKMIECTTGRHPFDYLNYGCYCGLGGRGRPLDAIDRCCYLHDKCYSQLRKRRLCNRFQLYLSGYDYSCSKCDSSNKGCSRGLCRCDRQAAKCFKRNKFNRSMKNVNKDKMC